MSPGFTFTISQVFPFEYQRALNEAAAEEEAQKKEQETKKDVVVNGMANGHDIKLTLDVPSEGMQRASSLSNVYGEDMINKLEDEDVSDVYPFHVSLFLSCSYRQTPINVVELYSKNGN